MNSDYLNSRNLQTPTDWEQRFSQFVTFSSIAAVLSTVILICDGGIIINLWADDVIMFFMVYFAILAFGNILTICLAKYEFMKAGKGRDDGSENSRLQSENER